MIMFVLFSGQPAQKQKTHSFEWVGFDLNLNAVF